MREMRKETIQQQYRHQRPGLVLGAGLPVLHPDAAGARRPVRSHLHRHDEVGEAEVEGEEDFLPVASWFRCRGNGLGEPGKPPMQ